MHLIRSQGLDERTCRYCLSVPRSPYIIYFSCSIHFPTNFINFSLCWKKILLFIRTTLSLSTRLQRPCFHVVPVVFFWKVYVCVYAYTMCHNLISPPSSPVPTHFPLPSLVFLPTSCLLKQLTNSVQLVLFICPLGEGYQLGHWQSANSLSVLSLRVPLAPQLGSGIRSPSASMLEFLTLLIKLVSFHKTSS